MSEDKPTSTFAFENFKEELSVLVKKGRGLPDIIASLAVGCGIFYLYQRDGYTWVGIITTPIVRSPVSEKT
jgi:hypothetical protein